MIELKYLLPKIIKNGSDCILNTKIHNFNAETFKNLKLVSQGCDTFLKSKEVSAKGIILKSNGLVDNRDKTSVARGDTDWRELGEYFAKKYHNVPKVNVYQAGASDGSESYTLSILLKEFLGIDAKKCFPIAAFDINHAVIQEAMKNQKNESEYFLHISNVRKLINKFDLWEDITNEYFKISDDGLGIRPESHVLESIKFKHANILDEWQNFDSQNPSIFLCRNMWPYIDEKMYDNFVKSLYNKLDKNSCILIGSFDNKPDRNVQLLIKDSLKKFGFKESDAGRNNYSFGPILFEK